MSLLVLFIVSYNGIGVKEVLRKQNLDGANRSLLHHVICCRRLFHSAVEFDKFFPVDRVHLHHKNPL